MRLFLFNKYNKRRVGLQSLLLVWCTSVYKEGMVPVSPISVICTQWDDGAGLHPFR